MTKRIDSLGPGTVVTLCFHSGSTSNEEKAVFLGIIGEGDSRRAKFLSPHTEYEISQGAPKTYEWEAYRYCNRWAYGTGADRLSLKKLG